MSTPSRPFARTHDLQAFWPLDALHEQDLYFYLEAIEGYLPDCRVKVAGHGEMIMLGGYSYLGLHGHPRINQAAQDAIARYGTGTYGVRLLSGSLDLHQMLEARIANFKHSEDAIVFSSGYLANLSAISSLVGRTDAVFCDKLDHASIVDGCRLSGANFVRFRHNDMNHLEQRLRDVDVAGTRLVVVDGVYSMDGDIADLPGLHRLCRRYDALLMVDEAHALGVLGATGHGIEEHFGLAADVVDIKMGTFSKAIPSAGGYVAGSHELCRFLKHQARGFVYSAALCPSAAAAALAALSIIEDEPSRVARLHENAAYFLARLRAVGFDCLSTASAVMPVICGDDWQAYRLARYCQKQGVYVQAIPHPVVPKGTARLRAAVSAEHRLDDLDHCVDVLEAGALIVGGILHERSPERSVP